MGGDQPRREGRELRLALVRKSRERSPVPAPIFAYRHGNTGTTGCAITGGAFYNPAQNTFGVAFADDYFFGDFCNGWIRRYGPRTDRGTGFATTPQFGLVDLGVSGSGDLYYLHRATNSLRKISRG
ncbi:MAG: hypothetical protein M3157_02300 [Actinomycetota bacterium]|nr:hypothetical protein [Actinomycetota bacterium]